MTDEPQAPPIIRLLQFGPIARGFIAVFAEPIGDDYANIQFTLESEPIDAFGLAELYFPGTQVVRIEPVSLMLDHGRWRVAQERPNFCGIARDGEPLENSLVDIDPYYEERLIGAKPKE